MWYRLAEHLQLFNLTHDRIMWYCMMFVAIHGINKLNAVILYLSWAYTKHELSTVICEFILRGTSTKNWQHFPTLPCLPRFWLHLAFCSFLYQHCIIVFPRSILSIVCLFCLLAKYTRSCNITYQPMYIDCWLMLICASHQFMQVCATWPRRLHYTVYEWDKHIDC